MTGYRGRHRGRQASIIGGALVIVAGLGIATGLTLSGGGPASAAALPGSCPPATPADAAAAATARAAAATARAAAAATVTPLPGAAQGIDISSNNPEPAWATVKSNGVSFVSIKATEGDYYINTATTTPVQQPGYAAEAADAANAGLYVMPYALANPYQGDGTPAHTTNGSGACQADYAWQEINSVTSPAYASSTLSLPVVLDIEPDLYVSSEGSNANECYGQTQSGLATWIGDFLTEMQADSGKTPVIYTSPDFWSACIGSATAFTTTNGTPGSFSSYPLWLADYGVTSPPALPAWPVPAFWQYTSGATVTGESGTVDADYLTPLEQTSKVGTAVAPVQVHTLSQLNALQAYATTATGLPPGLAINAGTGVISGTPTAAGSYTVQVTAGSTVSFVWDVTSALSIGAMTSQSTTMGTPVSLQVTTTDTNSGATVTYTASGLPAGLSINSATGLISGWPVTPASYSVKVTASDGQGATASATFSWAVSAAANTGVTGVIRQSGGSGKCVEDPSSATANMTPIDLVTCDASKSNQVLTAAQDGTIRVLGHCLFASGTGVFSYACNSSTGEQWRAGSFGSIVSARYGTCLNGPAGGVAEGTKVTLATCQNSASLVNQHWSRPVAPIVSGVAARCLNVVPLPGQAVTYYTCGNYATEHWALQPDGTLVVQSSGKCLTEHSTAGSALIQYNCVKGSPNQQFTIVAAGAIATELKSTESGLCVTVPAASSPNGSALVLGTCSTAALTSTWRVG